MTEKKKAPALKVAVATQKISKDELADLLKKAEADDPDAADNDQPLEPASVAASSKGGGPAKKK